MLAHHLRRWANIEPTLDERLMFAGPEAPSASATSNLNFNPLEVVSRYRDPQLQVAENYSNLFNLRQYICKL